ncbi:ATP-binding protein [Jatrophihabitans sp.]|uniref:ATP-binding protein n=1 Tax=Jatrophihabitans sp. TaxID=1932789 RepID=UPI0030C7639D|nr:rsbW [Jatrophihabitans sp.]
MSEFEESPIAGTVEVSVPVDVAYVATLRLVAASLAARCDLTVDDIEDLRLAVDEACALVLPLAEPDSTITAGYTLAPGELEVSIGVGTASTAASLDRTGFAWTVLTALASDVAVNSTAQRATITVTKRRETAQR